MGSVWMICEKDEGMKMDLLYSLPCSINGQVVRELNL